MIPDGPDLLYTTLLKTFWTRLYLDITTEARRRRLTEHDIGQIERRIFDIMRTGHATAHEFPTFEAEPIFARTERELQEFAASVRSARIKQIAQK